MNRVLPPDAFEFYVSLGVERSYQRVADHYGVTRRAVAKCAERESWATRLTKIESAVRSRMDQRLEETLEETRSRHLKTVRAMHARAVTALQQYPLTSGMEAMRAAEMCIKLERLIRGEASERSEITVEEVTKRELGRWLTTSGGDGDEVAIGEDVADEPGDCP